ncbi:MAG: tail fiber domain-containing protein [Chitinophagaceae bacterium]|nr:tail fiber domain-containing protein [Chitinophagaceae bacterium]
MKTQVQIKTLLTVFVSFFLLTELNAQYVSDRETMKNISYVNEPLDAITQLQALQYEYKSEDYKHLNLPEGQRYGFDADSVQRVFPSAVRVTPVRYMAGKNLYKTAMVKTVDYNSLIPLLIASINQQQKEIRALRDEVERLRGVKK